MPRVINYEKKFAEIEEKIAKKKEEIKNLTAQMHELKAVAAKNNIKELLDAIESKGLSVEEVIKWVEEYKVE